jgi:predicted PurR-regulated permease PerM
MSEKEKSQTERTKLDTTMPPSDGVVWVRLAPAQVVRTIAIAVLTAATVLGGLYLLWQVRTIIGWCILALFLAVVLNPAVNWLQRRGIKRSIGILLTYLGLVVALVVIAGIFVPLVISEILALINFIVTVAQTSGGFTEFLRGIAEQYGVGWLFDTLSDQLADLPSQLGEWAKSFLLSTGGILISTAGFATALVTILTLTFMMLVESERFTNLGLRVFAEPQRPRMRRLLEQSGKAISGYITGNLLISLICGVTTFIVLVIFGMPYPAALALLVALLDLIPLVGATLGGALLVIVGFFVNPLTAVILLVYILIYQQVEGSVLQPMVYSRSVQLHPLLIFIAVLVGAALMGIVGALLAIPVAEIIRVIATDLVAYRHMRQSGDETAGSSSWLQPPT